MSILTVEIETTTDDIQTGDKSYSNNPIALAARRVLPEVDGVTKTGFLRLKKKHRTHYPQVVPVPLKAASEPTKFVIAIRDETIRN
jgi:hypothetical protein